MHVQSFRSRHRACNVFPPLLDELFIELINARTVPALSESNGLHPAQEFFGIITQSTKASHKRVRNSILVCRGLLVFFFLVGFRCSKDLAAVLDLCRLMDEWCNACDIDNCSFAVILRLGWSIAAAESLMSALCWVYSDDPLSSWADAPASLQICISMWTRKS